MQASRLTDAQKKLIEDNLIEIKKILKYILGKSSNLRNFNAAATLLYEATSYLPEVTLEYHESLAKKITFAQFAASRCYLRLIDEYRKLNKNIRIQKHRQMMIKKVTEEIVAEKGSCTENDLVEKLKQVGGNLWQEYLRENSQKSITDDRYQFSYVDQGLVQVDWHDFKAGIMKKAEEFFKEYPGDHFVDSHNRSSRIHKILLKEHLLPKCQGESYKTLREIAEQVGLKESRLSQLIHGERMKRFMQSVYKDEQK